jgi:hypothetical protein
MKEALVMKELLILAPWFGMIVFFILEFGTWRLLQLRKVWIPLAVSILCAAIITVLANLADQTTWWWLPTILTAGAGWLAGGIYAFAVLLGRSSRVIEGVRRLQAIEDMGGVTSDRLKVGYRNPRKDLEKLLPLIEPFGHAPGHPEITPEWIRERLRRLDEKEGKTLGAAG